MSKKVFELRGLIYSKFDNEAKCAQAMGWPRQRLSKITNGKKEPDVEELLELSNVLNYSLEELAHIFLRKKSPNEQQSA